MFLCPCCFSFFSCNTVAVDKSPSTAISQTQEALQKMRISRQIHLPQLHTPEQITEVFVGRKDTGQVSTT